MKWHARGAPGHFAANQLADTTSHLVDTFGQLADSRIWSTRRRTGLPRRHTWSTFFSS